jgi:hypothetical protein
LPHPADLHAADISVFSETLSHVVDLAVRHSKAFGHDGFEFALANSARMLQHCCQDGLFPLQQVAVGETYGTPRVPWFFAARIPIELPALKVCAFCHPGGTLSDLHSILPLYYLASACIALSLKPPNQPIHQRMERQRRFDQRIRAYRRNRVEI